ncbi:MAG: N-acyl-D-amino-acid deacylase [Pyrococcus sp.]|uniref:N-acyl-D-amino-acid deacylase family protein n=1 Tax=Pyrococcus sp. TaxID=33866 RepID=UPI00258D587A|nr:amidohydrolase family protein [Pyrococcus sp.]MDK2870609.1 N-acyl-D-amino-acid deacylase [Pyrococcus sp.]
MKQEFFDLVIKDGKVVDGTGNPWFRADIGIKDGKIAKIGKIDEKTADKVTNAKGLIVTPSFIDMHSHDDLIFFKDLYNKPKLQQGVTTVVTGNCGLSPAPISKDTLEILKAYTGILGKDIDFKWSSYGEFLKSLEELGSLGTNVAGLVGHGTLRIAVMGMENRDPTTEEIEEMKKLLGQAMKDGAFGMSTGLIYPPGVYSKTEELIELSKVVAEYRGYYATHMRNESDGVIESIKETIRIGKEAGVPVHISHHKVAGKANWGRSKDTLNLIEQAREEGIDVTADAYPYTAGSTYLASVLPPWAHEGGEEKLKERCKDTRTREQMRKFIEERSDWQNFVKQTGWENIVLVYSPSFPEFEGKNILEISKEWNKDPYDVVFDIIAKDGTSAEMIVFMMDEGDVERIIAHPYVMVGTDGLDTGVGFPHPRAYGTFPRVLGVYARDKKLMTIEEAVRKMTSFPAQRLGLKDRGVIKEGMWADIVIFDPKKIRDKATYQNSREKPEGIEYVIVNGVISIEEGELTRERGGKVLRKVSS